MSGKVGIVGAGYVGLVTGTCLAETGNDVLCIDINEDKVQQMQRGEVPIYEPHLDLLFERNIKAGRLKFSTALEEGLAADPRGPGGAARRSVSHCH